MSNGKYLKVWKIVGVIGIVLVFVLIACFGINKYSSFRNSNNNNSVNSGSMNDDSNNKENIDNENNLENDGNQSEDNGQVDNGTIPENNIINGNKKIILVDRMQGNSCAQAIEYFYEDNQYRYYFTCIKSNSMYVIVDGVEYKLVDALKSGVVTMKELESNGYKFLKESKNLQIK